MDPHTKAGPVKRCGLQRGPAEHNRPNPESSRSAAAHSLRGGWSLSWLHTDFRPACVRAPEMSPRVYRVYWFHDFPPGLEQQEKETWGGGGMGGGGWGEKTVDLLKQGRTERNERETAEKKIGREGHHSDGNTHTHHTQTTHTTHTSYLFSKRNWEESIYPIFLKAKVLKYNQSLSASTNSSLIHHLSPALLQFLPNWYLSAILTHLFIHSLVLRQQQSLKSS